MQNNAVPIKPAAVTQAPDSASAINLGESAALAVCEQERRRPSELRRKRGPLPGIVSHGQGLIAHELNEIEF